MKTKLIALALAFTMFGAAQVSAGALIAPGGKIVGYDHDGTSNYVGGAYGSSWGMPGNWSYDCRFGYYVPTGFGYTGWY